MIKMKKLRTYLFAAVFVFPPAIYFVVSIYGWLFFDMGTDFNKIMITLMICVATVPTSIAIGILDD